MDPRIASGGSGAASTSTGGAGGNARSSAANLLFAIPLLLLAFPLLGLSRRLFRVKTAAGLGLCGALAAWAITVAVIGTRYLHDLAIWGITAAVFLLGAGLGATVAWPVGLAALSVVSGFALGLSILLMGEDGLIDSVGGRWGFIGALGAVGLAVLAFLPARWRHRVELVQASFVGAWLFSVAIDLFIHGSQGVSLGLRCILDGNSNHRRFLAYTPKLSTRLLMALSWIMTPIAAYAQNRVFPTSQPSPASQTASFVEEEEEVAGSLDNPGARLEKGHDDAMSLTSEKYNDPAQSESGTGPQDARQQTVSQLPMVPVQPDHLQQQQQQQQYQGHSRARSHDALNGSLHNAPRRHSRTRSGSSIPRDARRHSGSSSSPYHAHGQHSPSYRASSALALPSMSQLFLTATPGPGESTLSLPPNARDNSRRNSRIGYSSPAASLDAHSEAGEPPRRSRESSHPGPSVGTVGMAEAGQDRADTPQPSSSEYPSSSSSDHSRSSSQHSSASASQRAGPVTPFEVGSSSEGEEGNADGHTSEPQTSPFVVANTEQTAPTMLVMPTGEKEQHRNGTPALAPRVIYTSASSSEALSSAREQLHLVSAAFVQGRIVGTVAAPNGTASVSVRYSVDGWTTHADVNADAPTGADGRWAFSLPGEKPLALCLCARVPDGQEIWDSNGGSNYSLSP